MLGRTTVRADHRLAESQRIVAAPVAAAGLAASLFRLHDASSFALRGSADVPRASNLQTSV
jgi:hypothetical protein